MELGMVGLGRMGANMAERLVHGGHRVHGYDPGEGARSSAQAKGIVTADALAALVSALPSPRVVWLMVPAGKIVDDTLAQLLPLLQAGDIVIDGGNSYYKDSQRRAALLHASGSPCRLRHQRRRLGPAGRLQPDGRRRRSSGDHAASGPGHAGAGSGQGLGPRRPERRRPLHQDGPQRHRVRNDAGLCRGLRADAAQDRLCAGPAPGRRIWRDGSVVRSWLLDLTADALAHNPTMAGIAPFVADSGEGRWTVAEAIDLEVSAPIITLSLMERLRSRDKDSFTDKLLAAMRNQFGGHAVKTTTEAAPTIGSKDV